MASNRIRQWNLNVPAYKYDIDEQNAIVTIKEGSTEIFKFEAYDDATGDPGYINLLEIAQGVAGQVQVMIHGNPTYRLYGAQNVNRITFSAAGTGDLVGLNIRGNLGATAGKLEIAGHVVAPSVVTFKDLSWFGEVRVGGSVDPNAVIEARDSDYFGTIAIGQDLRGLVAVEGSLPLVTVNGSFGATGVIRADYLSTAVAIDYDGWQEGDDWEQGAYVRVGPMEPYEYFYGNTPSRKVWHITCAKGDMNNDVVVSMFDIDPFVLALTDPNEYAGVFFGLDGSMVYHADCDCSGKFDNFDIDPFILRLTNPCEYKRQFPDCDPCLAPCPPGEGGEGGLGAQAVADLHKQNVAPQRLPYVIDAAEFLAGWYKGTPRGKFWTEVHTALVK